MPLPPTKQLFLHSHIHTSMHTADVYVTAHCHVTVQLQWIYSQVRPKLKRPKWKSNQAKLNNAMAHYHAWYRRLKLANTLGLAFSKQKLLLHYELIMPRWAEPRGIR